VVNEEGFFQSLASRISMPGFFYSLHSVSFALFAYELWDILNPNKKEKQTKPKKPEGNGIGQRKRP